MCKEYEEGNWPWFRANTLNTARIVIAKVVEVAELENTGGCCFGVYSHLHSDFIIGPIPVGEEVNRTNIRQIQEQAIRLQEGNKLYSYLTSWQSRYPDLNRFGGTIYAPDGRGHDMSFSVSGLSEVYDELSAIFIALAVGHITEERASWIAARSLNTEGFDNLLKEVRGTIIRQLKVVTSEFTYIPFTNPYALLR